VEARWAGLLRDEARELRVELRDPGKTTLCLASLRRPDWLTERQAVALDFGGQSSNLDEFTWDWSVVDSGGTRSWHSTVGPDGADRSPSTGNLKDGDGVLVGVVTTGTLLGNDEVKAFSKLRQAQRHAAIVGALSLLDADVKDIEILGVPGMLHARMADGSYRPVGLLGEGAVHGLAMLLVAHKAARGLLLVDEIERGLHRSAQIEVVRALRFAAERDNIQVFATTHSYECIQAFDEVFADKPDDLALVRLQKVDGAIEPVVFSPESRSAALDAFSEVR